MHQVKISTNYVLLIEAHGFGTLVGDPAEYESIYSRSSRWPYPSEVATYRISKKATLALPKASLKGIMISVHIVKEYTEKAVGKPYKQGNHG